MSDLTFYEEDNGLTLLALCDGRRSGLVRTSMFVSFHYQQHQAVNFMLADMAIGIETSRLAVQRSAWEVDQVSGLLLCSNVVSTWW